ncbi:MAG: hypothetical protein DBX55_03075 [Verrucomicrobia bacterium]|nr:MAG: hypothetical protein DBX55_03075 [Verrucomicrobiota bacterium]
MTRAISAPAGKGALQATARQKTAMKQKKRRASLLPRAVFFLFSRRCRTSRNGEYRNVKARQCAAPRNADFWERAMSCAG